MSEMSTLEMVLVGALVLVVVLWVGRGIGPLLRESREAPKDWPGLLLPIGGVILFVVVLMLMVSR